MRRMVAMAAVLAIGAAPAPQERVIAPDGVVEGRIGETPLRLRIDPGATAMPLVTTAIAERAGLKAGMFGTVYGVGPVRIPGRTAVGWIDFGTGPVKRRISFAPKPYAAGFDGVVGPGGLAEPVVRFVLRAAVPGERTVALPMVDQGGMMGNWAERFALVEVGGERLRVRFDPHHARTLATAAAGVRLAAAFGGTVSGGTEPEEIAFGVSRPVRALALARPLTIGPLAIRTLGVRTTDNGNAAGIAEAGADADPNEVVVTAKGKGKHDPDCDRLSLGADVLARCSSIVFDTPAKAIRLTCA